MKKYINVKTKKTCIFAILALLILTFAILVNRVRNGVILCALIMAIGTLDFSSVNLSVKTKRLVLCAVLLISSVVISSLSQHTCNETLLQLPVINIMAEIMIVLVLLVVLLLIFRSEKVAITVAAVPIILFSTIDYYVYCFRGNEITPSDLLSIRTALAVVPNYQFESYSFHLYVFAFFCVFLALIWSGLKIVDWKYNGKSYFVGLISVLVLIVCISFCYKGIVPNHFAINGTHKNGYLVNFVSQLKESIIFKPSGYSEEAVNKIYEEYDLPINEDDNQENPDIIVIMNESFADMNHVGDLPVNTDVTPYLDSLSEYIYKGYTLSSVYGGGTPNSEYEFLTGNSMMFFPKGMIAYQQIIKSPAHSLVADLNRIGYKCIAMHPFHSGGWMRTKIYPWFGFSDMYFLDAFPDDKLIRDYVSDQAMYEVLLEKYHEASKNNKNVFIFGVTMQNHGGYEYSEDDFQKTIELEFESGNQYPEAEQYLSLIHESDNALKYLLEELKKEKRKVVVLFYGDHFPKLEDEFYKELYGSDFKSLDEIQLKYTVPFLIWTNYSSKNENVPLTSMNYLSTYLMEAAGIELPAYNVFLKDVNDVSCAMNSNGIYINEEKKFYEFSSSILDKYNKIRDYNYLVYNSAKGHRNEQFFPITNLEE